MILLALMGLINFDGKYTLDNVKISEIRTITIDYSFEEPCKLHLYFTRGYEFYGIDVDVKDTRGTIEFNLQDAKFIPTRRKPVHIPPTLEGTCRGTIYDVNIR